MPFFHSGKEFNELFILFKQKKKNLISINLNLVGLIKAVKNENQIKSIFLMLVNELDIMHNSIFFEQGVDTN